MDGGVAADRNDVLSKTVRQRRNDFIAEKFRGVERETMGKEKYD
jgi:hypothetical protein